tara:strand:- start:651 stop:758 length:108 start_codon:yes stop_codon:yes gene_type:complete
VTYLLYEIGRALLDNNNDVEMDCGMMISEGDGEKA